MEITNNKTIFKKLATFKHKSINQTDFKEEGRFDVRPFLDSSDGGTLDNPPPTPIVVWVLIFAIFVGVISLIISKLKPLIHVSNDLKKSPTAKNENSLEPQSNKQVQVSEGHNSSSAIATKDDEQKNIREASLKEKPPATATNVKTE